MSSKNCRLSDLWIVATIGKLPRLKEEERVGWEKITRVVNGKSKPAGDLFEKRKNIPEWATVDISRVQVERMRRFGDSYLGLILWKRLKLDKVFEKLQGCGREEIGWRDMFCVLALARFCQPSSELAIAESWYGFGYLKPNHCPLAYEKTALEDLLNVSVEKINEQRLYRSLDYLIPHKDEICKHLQEQYAEWFGAKFDFLFYDLTSTYFEGECERNPQAKRGYSLDKQPDCKQVCIGLVVNSDGLPVGYEVFDGDRRDVTTLEEMVELMEDKYGKAQRVWVLDRGIVSEDNLDYLHQRGAQYVVGTLKVLLKNFKEEIGLKDWDEVENGVEVRIVRHLDYGDKKFILCRSTGREQKERAMLERQVNRLDTEMQKIKAGIIAGRLRNVSRIERRIGR